MESGKTELKLEIMRGQGVVRRKRGQIYGDGR